MAPPNDVSEAIRRCERRTGKSIRAMRTVAVVVYQAAHLPLPNRSAPEPHPVHIHPQPQPGDKIITPSDTMTSTGTLAGVVSAT